MAKRQQRDAYIAIMVAAATGRGINLTWDECADLALDDAISTRAANALDEGEFKGGGIHYMGDVWRYISPYRRRDNGYNGASKDDKGRM